MYKTLLAFGICLCPGLLYAEAPQIKSLFPAGLQRGTSAELKLNGKIGTLPAHVWVDSDQLNQFQLSEKGDLLTVTASPDARLGIHWIRFYNSEGSSSLLPIQVGPLSEFTEKEPNNVASEAEAIAELPVTVNGVLHKSGEVDTFALTLNKGERFIASIDAHAALGSPMDAVLQILDENGFVIVQNNDDHDLDPFIEFLVPRDGKYLVRTFCFPATPNSTINFAGGSDYVYRLDLTTDQFELTPRVAKKSERIDSPGLHHFFTALGASDVAESNKSEKTLPYSEYAVLDTLTKLQKVTLNLNKGDSLRVEVLARQIGSHLDPVLTIRKPDGAIHKETDDPDRNKRDIDYLWTAPADGDYSFEVTDRFQHFGERYYSFIKLTKNSPRVELSVAADHFKFNREKPLEIPVTVERSSGFKQQISVTVKNPPPGLNVEAVTSEEKGDSAKKVTLKLDASTADAFSGLIEIVGVVADSDEEVLAQADLKVMQQKTSSLWLTIPAKPEEKSKQAED